MARRALVPLVCAIPCLLILLSTVQAQVTSVTGELTLPRPGAGHDYIHMLDETVNPVNGAVSIRISVPVPPSRGLTIPFQFGYDSNAAHHFILSGSGVPLDNASYLAAGGWSYVMPYLTMVQHVKTVEYSTNPPQFSHCYYYTDFLFTNLQGSSDLLGLSTSEQNGAGPCVPGNNGYSNWLTGSGESFESAAADGSGTQYPTAVTVSQLDGTVYHFPNTYPGRVHPSANNIGWASLPDWVEDRNGNKITISDSGGGVFSITDTMGRLLSSSGVKSTGNTISVSGLSSPYQITWGQAASNTAYGTKLYYSGVGGVCTPAPVAPDGTFPEITQIKLPNGKSYQFQYDANAGVVSKIIYPTGGYVRYAWGKNLLSDKMDFLDNKQTNTSPNCHEEYDTQAVTDRYVSFDGVTESLHQHFTYTTTWNTAGNWPMWTTKNTSVTTYDLVRGTNFLTLYQYTPSQFDMGSEPNDPITYSGNIFPVESSVTYYSTSGSILRTVYKGFVSPTLPPDEKVVLDNNQTSQTTHTYLSEYTTPPQPCSVGSCTHGAGLAVPTDEYQYDYGPGAPGILIKRSHTDYGAIGQTPIGGVFIAPSDTITYDGSGNRAAETDYSYDQTAVSSVPSATGHDETHFSSSYQNRGNVTTITKQCFIGSTACVPPTATSTYTYDETGQTTAATDALNNTTQYSFTDNYAAGSGTPPGNTNAYLTTIIRPTVNGVTQHEYYQYAYSDGQLTQQKDDNQNAAGVATNYLYNDSLRRLTETDYADGGITRVVYNDAAPNPSMTSCKLINGVPGATCSASSPPTGWLVTLASMDGIGHVIQTQIPSDPEGTDLTDTTYDGLELVRTKSNPHRSGASSTDGITTYSYDSLGRPTTVSEPDTSVVTTSYSGNQTTVTDEAGSQRESQTDALGRLTKVWEAPNASGYNFETDYQYNALDNLICAVQKGTDTTPFSSCASSPASWRPRSFIFNSLSQLTSATNPESGTILYTYDASGNVASKVAPQPNQTGSATVTTSYSYDALSRITQKSYSDGTTPTAQFIYDVSGGWGSTPQTNIIGRLSEASSGTSPRAAEIFGYDSMGRVVLNYQCTPSNCGTTAFPVNYSYDLAGDLTSGSNGEGFTISYGYDAAQHPTQVTSNFVDSQHPATLFTADSSVGYFPPGQLRKGTFGNGLVQTNVYNNRLQPCLLDLVNSSSVTLQTCNDSTPSGNVLDLWMGYGATTNNGNVLNWNATGAQSFIRTYSYDMLNRISTMSDTASSQSCKGLQWTYDAWANRIGQAVTSGSCFSFNNAANTQNQLTGYQYDAAGNLTNDGSHSYTYDAENRIVTVDGGATSYVYDAEGHRAEKSGWSDYIHDLSGHTVAQVDPNGWQVGYVYLGSSLIAQYDNSTTHFVHSDHLGSTRLLTSLNDSVYDSLDFQPFGEQSTGDTGTSHKFTGKERDSESGLDMFGARYYGTTIGRFMTPDWYGAPATVPYADFNAPQTLNLYSYEHNNPLSKADDDGHGCSVGGELHNSVWCWFHNHGHLFGLGYTQSELADVDRKALAGMHNIGFHGTTPQQVAQTGSNKEVIAYFNALGRSFALNGVPSPLMLAANAIGPGFPGLKTATPVGSALKEDLDHQAAFWMREQAAEGGAVFNITDQAGNPATLIQMPGELNGVSGRFEYIVDQAGQLVHEMFVRGGGINGIPIKP